MIVRPVERDVKDKKKLVVAAKILLPSSSSVEPDTVD